MTSPPKVGSHPGFLVPLLTALMLCDCGSRGALGTPDSGLLLDIGKGGETNEASPPRNSCIVAIHLDECCSTPIPFFRQMINTDRDPCLVPFSPHPHPAREIPQVCQDKWPDRCMTMSCTWGYPLSRLVEAQSGGGCGWKSECTPREGGCTWGVDLRDCCGCGLPIPSALPLEDPCVVNIAQVWESWPDQPPGCADACPTGFSGCDKECYSPPPGPIPCRVSPADPSLNLCRF